MFHSFTYYNDNDNNYQYQYKKIVNQNVIDNHYQLHFKTFKANKYGTINFR